MIVVIKNSESGKQLDNLLRWIKGLGLGIHISRGEKSTVIGLIGDTSKVDIDLLRSLDIVENVTRIQEPFKNANRKFHPEDSVIEVGGVKFGGKHFQIIAGPCSVESERQVIEIAQAVKAAGAAVLRGGAFKPRSSPYSFQGLGLEGLKYLIKAREETGLPIVTELMSEKYLDAFADVDIVQIGARNMQNFELLKEVGKINKPVLLKRGLANTIEEWLMSAEYIMAEGNSEVILCERGIRTFEPYTRNTLDLSAIPILKEKTHLPVIVDPSHASGQSRLVRPLSLASVGAGADGLIIEVHNNPECALCDGAQSLKPDQFAELASAVRGMLDIVGKETF
ncbi:MAG TPA: 3-deoxy-7-phosphoheptulonate synthase [Eubacteriales bacterium]|jgi:3-deoxy-7-phosphoheptulonate synthase|nr:3-deoxy-7-phosphoheptulonate synthase [Eubacteriales bacterium]HRU84341.1 3-deoxy-7-phosphoheptulonate synthase [Eubacteriales bacterium]